LKKLFHHRQLGAPQKEKKFGALGTWGRLKMHDLKMQDWKMTDKILAHSGQNYGVWKMQDWIMTDHVN